MKDLLIPDCHWTGLYESCGGRAREPNLQTFDISRLDASLVYRPLILTLTPL